MSIEAFQNLIEIQSLLDRNSTHSAAIEAENLRINHLDKINDRKVVELNNAINQLSALADEISAGEKRIEQINKLLEKMKEDYYGLKNEKEIETFKVRENSLTDEKSNLENSLFEKLESEEQINEQVNDLKSFLEGMKKTKEDISLEVQNVIQKEQIAIDGYVLRINALIEELPKDAQSSFNSAIKKYPTKFLSFVESIRCGVCRYEIERNTVALIDRAQVFELCGSCGRLLAPKHLPARL